MKSWREDGEREIERRESEGKGVGNTGAERRTAIILIRGFERILL